MAILKRTSSFVVDKLEQLFYKWGCFVSKHPKSVIFGCLLITALSALGLFNLRVEARAEKLWISPKSPYISDKGALILLCRIISEEFSTIFEWTLVSCHLKLL